MSCVRIPRVPNSVSSGKRRVLPLLERGDRTCSVTVVCGGVSECLAAEVFSTIRHRLTMGFRYAACYR